MRRRLRGSVSRREDGHLDSCSENPGIYIQLPGDSEHYGTLTETQNLFGPFRKSRRHKCINPWAVLSGLDRFAKERGILVLVSPSAQNPYQVLAKVQSFFCRYRPKVGIAFD